MKFERFKSGVYRKQYQYKSFLPSKINQERNWDDSIINVLLGKSSQGLGELNAISRILYELLTTIPVKVTVVIR